MPEMDGYETTREIRRQEALAGDPHHRVDRQGPQGRREKCLQAGMTDYLAKPVQSHALFGDAPQTP